MAPTTKSWEELEAEGLLPEGTEIVEEDETIVILPLADDTEETES